MRPLRTIYSEKPEILGLPENGGQSQYYPQSPSIMKSEIEAVQDTLSNLGLFLQHTRLKKKEEHGEISYELLLASAECKPYNTPETKVQLGNSSVKIQLTYGDHSTELKKVVNHIADATKYSRSQTQTTYLDNNIHHIEAVICRTTSMPRCGPG
jgi:dipeptidyl-peptidase-3